MRLPCAKCGIEHDLDDLEPSFARPEAIDRIPIAERDRVAKLHKDFASLERDTGSVYFLRVLIPVDVSGRAHRLCWGIWTEVSSQTFFEVRELWDDENQLLHPPWPASLANSIASYQSTVGLPGTIRFVDKTQIPHFTFSEDVAHTFATEVRQGVPASRAAQWQELLLHST